jgi:uncharacterized protein YeaO (DUF488 family)
MCPGDEEMPFEIRVKDIRDPVESTDGQRILVDRLWPRGVSKEHAALTLWLKEIAPSTELRQWFGHKPERWDEFRQRYFEELKKNQEPLRKLLELHKQGDMTLLFDAHERRYNNAIALAEYLREAVRNL